MRIAVTTNGRNVSEEFGSTIKFTIFEVLRGQTKGKLLIDVSASGGQDALIYILKNEGVEVLLCGKISEQIKKELEKYGIRVMSGLRGNIQTHIRSYIRDHLKDAR